MDATATRSRGRPRTFDEDAVLDALTSLFWRQGYEATSMSDIAETTGLNRSSLYNAFGSKHDLFTRVLDRYITSRMRRLEALAADAGDGIGALHAFLEVVQAEMDSEIGRNGCLAVNTSTEMGSDDAEYVAFAERYRTRMAEAVRSLVERGAASGDLDPTQVEHHTDVLTMFMLGMSVTVRSGAAHDEIVRLIDAAHATIDSWRV